MVSIRILAKHKRVLIDTSIWIYHFEQHAIFGANAGQIDGRMTGSGEEPQLSVRFFKKQGRGCSGFGGESHAGYH